MAKPAKKGDRRLRVVDLFCGPGGLSEGMRQAGFDTVFALDYEKQAVESLAANHPEAVVVHDDIRNLDPATLPECDIIVGGPPCIEFSTSKGSRGNILDGLELVQAYLRIVHYVKPKWWIMENVPRVTKFLPDTIPLSWIGLNEEGTLSIPARCIFNAAEFGVPQRRKRFLMGNYPVPTPTHVVKDSRELQLNVIHNDLPAAPTLGDILESLPTPGLAPKKKIYADPNYGFELSIDELTDQFHETWIDPQEVERLRDVKLNHPYMGKMSFPDDLNQPSRTVVATQLGRETLVIEDRGRFRRPTVREVATMQSFPLTYQFFGSASARYRLVGDAVPPLLGYAIGRLIREEAGLPPMSQPAGASHATRRAAQLPPLPDRTARKAQNKPDRKFSQMIPGKEVRGCRAELDNRGQPAEKDGVVGWRAMLHIGEGSARQDMEVDSRTALNALITFSDVGDLQERLADLFREADSLFASSRIDAQALQTTWVETQTDGGPDQLAAKASAIIDRWLPRSDWSELRRAPISALPILKPSGIRLRVAAGLALAAQIAEIAHATKPEAVAPLYDRWLKKCSGPVVKDLSLTAPSGRQSLF
jgi:DNA (cytosine-5)-methyltransferase 1